MHIKAINVGQPQAVQWKNKIITTSIFKYPVAGTKKVSWTNVEGDAQADLRFHGGRDKAVYAYDNASYDAWKAVLPELNWEVGIFGENLTTEGLYEGDVKIGDCFQIGSVILKAVQPRIPCFKINVRFNRDDMLERFYNFKHYGIYFRVEQEGEITTGDAIQKVQDSPYTIGISDAVDCFITKGQDQALLEEILAIPILPDGIRKTFLKFRKTH